MVQVNRFENRNEAGKFLADKLLSYREDDSVIVLALPRGGVPVASVIAYELKKPLDIFLVKKIGTPGQEELALGAVSSSGEIVINWDLANRMGVDEGEINSLAEEMRKALKSREALLRSGAPALDIANHRVILVDDGLATGATMLTAIRAIKKLKPLEIIVAVPVASWEAYKLILNEANIVICPLIPEFFYSVGMWFEDFRQVTDGEVIALLGASQHRTKNYHGLKL